MAELRARDRGMEEVNFSVRCESTEQSMQHIALRLESSVQTFAGVVTFYGLA